MNKRRRFKAKRTRKLLGGVRGYKRHPFEYQTCSTCGDYIMACTCYEETIWRERKVSLSQFADGANL